MKAIQNRSRIESSAKTAKPIASPRAEALAQAMPAKKTAQSRTARTRGSSPLAKLKPGKRKVVSSKLSFKGRVFNVYTDTVIEPSGHKTVRDVVRHNGSVVILAVDESQDASDPTVILERQYRHAAGQYLIELPAGTRDPGEQPLAAAKREMIEETGYRAKSWKMLLRYYASPGFLGEWMQIYLARELSAGEAKPELDEQIEILRMPLSKAMQLVREGKIHDGKTLIGLSLYDAARREGRL